MIKYNIELTENEIFDFLCTALEGGIGYWAILQNKGIEWKNARKKVKEEKGNKAVFEDICIEVLKKGKALKFKDEEGEGYKALDGTEGTEKNPWLLSLAEIKRGFELASKNGRNVNINDMDALEADVIVQYGIFGKIVFG